MTIHDLNTKTPTSTDYLAGDTGSDTYKATLSNVVANAAPAFTNADSSTATSWTSVSVLSSGLSIATLLNRISTMFKNIRYLYNQVTELNGKFSDLLITDTVTATISSIAAGAAITQTFDVSKSGYTPIGISFWGKSGAGSGYIVMTAAVINSAQTTVTGSFYNMGSSAYSSIPVTLTVLYLKN